MTRGWPPGGVPPATKPRLREPEAAAGGDFVWPPPADDAAACSIVMLAEVADAPRPRTTVLADEPLEAFPDIDFEAALDAFADPPAASRLLPAPRPPLAGARSAAQPPAPRWLAAARRSLVTLCFGASLALMPPPGLTRVLDARPAVGSPQAASPTSTPRIVTPPRVRAIRTPVGTPTPDKTLPRDEDRIRATLAALETAYSRLDAGAAREVWPSVDVDALAHAFDGLQSQELRFDHCDVTVAGGRARAACSGEAFYVPRVGSRATTPARAWSFELTRIRERWLIASARAS
jgi:hypothetical protein